MTKTKKKKTAAAPAALPEVQPHSWTHVGTEVLILRRTGQDRKSHNGFTYPAGVGSTVEARDFNTKAECGGGMHGWPWGFGLGEGQDYSLEDLWIVLGADPADVVGNLNDGNGGTGWKCKCRAATIRYEGNMKGAMDLLRSGFTACVEAMAAPPAGSKYSAKVANSGDSASLESTGKDSVIMSTDAKSRVRMVAGGSFAFALFEEGKGWRFLTARVGEDGIEADTWYTVKGGKIAPWTP
jgi:hypothetical protein